MNYSCLSGGPINANCYIVRFATCAYIIDPAISLSLIKEEVKGLPVKGIILTHAHADHICNLKEVEDYYNCQIICSQYAIEKIESSKKNYSISMGQTFSYHFAKEKYHLLTEDTKYIDDAGNRITFLMTPGHSSCSISILIEKDLFSGDTLFKESAGRTDLYSGSEKELSKSLAKLKQLDNDIRVLPGHDFPSTIKQEKLYNPYFKNL